jgi:hypothetical protein
LRAFALDLDLGFGFAVGFSSFDFNVLIFWSLLLLKRLTLKQFFIEKLSCCTQQAGTFLIWVVI